MTNHSSNDIRHAVTAWVQGGLGNQLFQLNAALNLSAATGAPTRLSLASFARDQKRNFEASRLVSQNSVLSWSEELLLGSPYRRDGSLRSQTPVSRVPIVSALHRSDGPVAIPALLVGFFQDKESISLGTSHVTSRLQSAKLAGDAESWLARVSQSVVAHVRRGDYVRLDSARRTFGYLGRDYYERSFERLGVSRDEVIFFSDEPDAVVREFSIPRGAVVGPDDVKSVLDTLILMGRARSIVIPNSTFSWWASETVKEVVAPSTWFFDRGSELWPTRSRWQLVDN